MEKYLTMKDLSGEVGGIFPLSKYQIYRMIAAGTFPKQIKLSDNRVVWLSLLQNARGVGKRRNLFRDTPAYEMSF